jgi:hypothetical protein
MTHPPIPDCWSLPLGKLAASLARSEVGLPLSNESRLTLTNLLNPLVALCGAGSNQQVLPDGHLKLNVEFLEVTLNPLLGQCEVFGAILGSSSGQNSKILSLAFRESL